MEPDQTTVEILERWLEDAKAGRILDVAIAGVKPDRYVAITFSKDADVNLLLAAATGLQASVQAKWLRSAQPDPPVQEKI